MQKDKKFLGLAAKHISSYIPNVHNLKGMQSQKKELENLKEEMDKKEQEILGFQKHFDEQQKEIEQLKRRMKNEEEIQQTLEMASKDLVSLGFTLLTFLCFVWI